MRRPTRCGERLRALERAIRILIEAALALLPDLERRVIVGIYLVGLRQLEVARRLDLSAKQISRLHGVALSRMQRLCADALAS